MLRKTFLFSFLILAFNTILAQSPIDVNNIEIVRDNYGVPHIFSKTDAEAVYGIGWAQCEDNFHMLQDNFAASKNMAGRIIGKKGAALDLIFQIFQIEGFVEKNYERDISPEIDKMLRSYSAAINRYAELHPKEVKSDKLFPITPKRILAAYTLQTLLLHHSLPELAKVISKEYEYEIMEHVMGGSNAMAYSPNKTSDGKTYLIGNPHQPLNEPGNFWELSVHSEEGYEFFGVTFSVGGLVPIMGTNRNLGWSHTTNYQNGSDAFKLEMHPNKKNHYKYDGEWLPLEKKKAKMKVKIGPLALPVSKKYYQSKYGPTFKKKSGFYSYKANSFFNLKIVEQWYKMGLAKNIEEFTNALDIQGICAQTITYGDFEGNIFHLSNFSHPIRNEAYDWSAPVSGTGSDSNWNYQKQHPVSALPQVKNPDCGYVYNCNNTVFKMTGEGENPKPEDFPKSFELMTSNTIRANTFAARIKEFEKINFEEAREIREDVSVDKNQLSFRNCMNCNEIPRLIAENPKLKEYKKVLDKWDGNYNPENKQASLMLMTTYFIVEYIQKHYGNLEKDLPEEVMTQSMLKAEKFLLKHYGSREVVLGEILKAVRDDVELPMYGSTNTLANSHGKIYQKKKLRIVAGDSFIFYAKYGADGLEEMNTINAFGNSMKKGHPHSTDQTALYVKKETKKVELDVEKLRKSGKAYHPK